MSECKHIGYTSIIYGNQYLSIWPFGNIFHQANARDVPGMQIVDRSLVVKTSALLKSKQREVESLGEGWMDRVDQWSERVSEE